MKILITETIEDSFSFPVQDKKGKWSVGYDVRKFHKGQTYDLTDVHPNWDDRAKGFIDAKLAKVA